MGLANEHEKIAIAIGETMVSYEPKLAIAHNVATALGIDTRASGEFRSTVLAAHLRVKAEWHPAWEATPRG